MVVKTVDELRRRWNGVQNFLIDPELFRFEMDFPPAEEVVDILRRDPDARRTANVPVLGHQAEAARSLQVQIIGDFSHEEQEERTQAFRTSPIEDIVDSAFTLSHFKLSNFYGPGQFLEEFQDRVMIPWRTFLSSAGLTWQRCYPIIFISGRNRSLPYHVDNSHVVAWQIWGVKTFNAFRNPTHYAPLDDCVNRPEQIQRADGPPDHDPEDVLSYRMEKGDLLWSEPLTPHWVPAGDEIAMSVNISHGGIQYRGELCPHEVALWKRWKEHPEEAWLVDTRY